MSMKDRLMFALASGLARRGFEVRRHPAARRQAVFVRHQIDLVLDVGAAHGEYGTSLRSFGYSGDIVSFEPLPEAFDALSEITAEDPRWTARKVALGRESGEATINVASNSNSSSLLPMLDAHVDAAPSIRYVGQKTIAVSRLDDEMGESMKSYNRPFLKVDTQGFEREVLAGGVDTVAACVGLQLELSFVSLYDGGMIVDEAVNWAYAHGFHLVGIEQGYAAPGGEVLQMDGVFIRADVIR